MRIPFDTALLALAVASAATLPSPAHAEACRIRGSVVDAFGQPLAGVDVGVDDVVMREATDEAGAFDMDCGTSRGTLWLKKDGYLPVAMVLDVSAVHGPRKIEMLQVPPTQGVFVRGAKEYTEIPSLRLDVVDRASGDQVKRQYHVPAGVDLPRVEGPVARLLDHDPRPLALVAAQDDLVATESYPKGDLSAPSWLEARRAGESARNVADVSLRDVRSAGDAVLCLVPTTCMKGHVALAVAGTTSDAYCFVTNQGGTELPAAARASDLTLRRQSLGAARDVAQALALVSAGGKVPATNGPVEVGKAGLTSPTGVVPAQDAWGHALIYAIGEDGSWAVASPGPDGRLQADLLDPSVDAGDDVVVRSHAR